VDSETLAHRDCLSLAADRAQDHVVSIEDRGVFELALMCVAERFRGWLGKRRIGSDGQ
jgi:hypothetical protein